LFDAPLTFREFMSREEIPLASIFRLPIQKGWLPGLSARVLLALRGLGAAVHQPDAQRAAEEIPEPPGRAGEQAHSSALAEAARRNAGP
jgi:hypothetical protein